MESKIKQHRLNRRYLSFVLAIASLMLISTIVVFAPLTQNSSSEQNININTVHKSENTQMLQDVIVGFTNTPDPQLLTKYNATILEVYTIIPAIHALMPQNSIDQLEKNSAIEYITENSPIKLATTNEEDMTNWQNWPQWPLQLIDAPAVWAESTGAEVKIALLDTGIAPIADLPFYVGYNYVERNSDTTDRNGHGTRVASLIVTQHTSPTGLRGVAPDAEVYAVKVLDDQGKGSVTQAILGIQWAVDYGMHIISMSFGFEDLRSPSLERTINTAYNRGILIVAAAGNNGNTNSPGVVYPAKYDAIIAVSAINERKVRWDFSSFGPEVELAAPGENILTRNPDNTVHSYSGTSLAVPYVTGTAALIWAKNNSLTNTDVRNILCQTATNPQSDDRDIYYGYGLINAASALQISPTNNNNNNTPTPTPTPTTTSTNTAAPTAKTTSPPTTAPPVNTQTPPPTTTTPTPTNTQTPPPTTTTPTNIIITIASSLIILIIVILTVVVIQYNKNKNLKTNWDQKELENNIF